MKVFSKCLECNEYLSGQQRKFCCCWCKDIHITRIKREYEGNKQLTKMKREAKMIFNRWTKEGNKLVDLIEKESYDLDLEEVTELIEDSVHELRTNTLKLIE